MKGWRGVFAGALTLVAMQAVLSSRVAPGKVGGLFGAVGAVATAWLDPSKPAIPDRRVGAAASSTAPSSSTTSPAGGTPATSLAGYRTVPVPRPQAPADSVTT